MGSPSMGANDFRGKGWAIHQDDADQWQGRRSRLPRFHHAEFIRLPQDFFRTDDAK